MSGASDRCAGRQTWCGPGEQSRGAVEVLRVLVSLAREEEGQDLVEYALLITFIALACIVGMQQLGTAINNNYRSISNSLAS
jgi:Flp pilus assembly pilin Flp